VQRPEVPEGAHPVDHFIDLALDEAGLERNPPADPHTLLRRATLDLTGLPPTREEIADFLAAHAEDPEAAWEALVDRLLDSPHYGERWGRHWLDVARYVQGEIKVPGVDEIDLAAPYRDYVVRAFNADKPYDRFIAEQLAGDLLRPGSERDESPGDDLDRRIAPAFLSIGQWFDECTDPNKLRLDIVDEQISAATRAFLALDFSCARCHDHKFDPVPTRDYYALAGIFKSTEITSHFAEDWRDGRPRAVQPVATRAESAELETKLERRSRLIAERRARLEATRAAREAVPVPAAGLPETVAEVAAVDFAGHKELKTKSIDGLEVLATRRRLDQWARYRFPDLPAGDYTLLVRYAAAEPSPVEIELEGETRPERVLGRATYGEAGEEDFRWEAVPLGEVAAGTLHLRLKVGRHEPFPTLERLRLVAGTLEPADSGSGSPDWRHALAGDSPTLAEWRDLLDGEDPASASDLAALEEECDRLLAALREREFAVAVHDAAEPADLPVHIAGETYRTDGDPVPRGMPSLADALVPAAFDVPEGESGRRQFAAWLAHPDHPLTSRVMVNRLWHWHFGRGLVATTDDFGRQGALPTHPELLDWLASEFVAGGWSVKSLQRLLLTSGTYRASALSTEENLARDPDGALLSRYPARRLEIEAIYDSLLTSIGKVPRQPPGMPLENRHSKDRALYILTSARSPMGLGIEIRKMFPLFGFDPSGRPMHQRDATTTPAQGLWWLNNPLPRHYATLLAEQLVAEHPDDEARALAAHETLLSRPPDDRSRYAIVKYVERGRRDEGLSNEEAWTRACLGLMSSKAFRTLE